MMHHLPAATCPHTISQQQHPLMYPQLCLNGSAIENSNGNRHASIASTEDATNDICTSVRVDSDSDAECSLRKCWVSSVAPSSSRTEVDLPPANESHLSNNVDLDTSSVVNALEGNIGTVMKICQQLQISSSICGLALPKELNLLVMFSLHWQQTSRWCRSCHTTYTSC